jgi:hypothetical protein
MVPHCRSLHSVPTRHWEHLTAGHSITSIHCGQRIQGNLELYLRLLIEWPFLCCNYRETAGFETQSVVTLRPTDYQFKRGPNLWLG